MKTYLEIAEIIGNIAYTRHEGKWKVKLGITPGTERRATSTMEVGPTDMKTLTVEASYYPGDPYLQLVGEENGEKWTGRKWRLSYHMTTSEIVYTAFKAVQAAEDHELREFFVFKGVPVCHPHICVEDFVERWNAGLVKFDVRDDAMSGA